MKNLIRVSGWISGVIGIIMMLLGVIAVFAGGIFLNHHWTNYFYPGGMFVVLGIFFFLGTTICKLPEKE
jgi:hypothetical protein